MDQAQILRQMMRQQNKKDVRILTVTSGKGGVGKSSLSINLALALQKRGRRVLIMDTDFGLANIDIMLGSAVQYNLSHVISGQKDIRDIIVRSPQGVQFISGGSGVYDLLTLQGERLSPILENLLALDDLADILIFDTGAGVNDNILRLIEASHETLLVTTPEPTAIMDAYALIKTADQLSVRPRIRVIVNKCESEREAAAAMGGLLHMARKYTSVEVAPLGYLMRDDNMVRAVKLQLPLLVSFPGSATAERIMRLADQLIDSPASPREQAGLAGFFTRLFARKPTGGDDDPCNWIRS